MGETTAAPIGEIGQPGQKLNLNAAMDHTGYAAQQAAMTDRAMESAFSQALRLPGSLRNQEVSGSRVMNGSAGEVGDEKAKLVSELNPTGAESSANTSSGQSMDSMTQRISSLYLEMTNWQVAWSIAQRTQQDTNHLLKGN
ncbi:MAG: hypothetical protein AAFP85_11790 [Pseudomonadota bacterium]